MDHLGFWLGGNGGIRTSETACRSMAQQGMGALSTGSGMLEQARIGGDIGVAAAKICLDRRPGSFCRVQSKNAIGASND